MLAEKRAAAAKKKAALEEKKRWEAMQRALGLLPREPTEGGEGGSEAGDADSFFGSSLLHGHIGGAAAGEGEAGEGSADGSKPDDATILAEMEQEEKEAAGDSMDDDDELPPNPLLEDVDLDESLMSILGRAIMDKLSGALARHEIMIPFNEDPDFRMEDGKRWWEVSRPGPGVLIVVGSTVTTNPRLFKSLSPRYAAPSPGIGMPRRRASESQALRPTSTLLSSQVFTYVVLFLSLAA